MMRRATIFIHRSCRNNCEELALDAPPNKLLRRKWPPTHIPQTAFKDESGKNKEVSDCVTQKIRVGNCKKFDKETANPSRYNKCL